MPAPEVTRANGGIMNNKYLKKMKNAFKVAECTEKELSALGVEIVDRSETGMIFALVQYYIKFELGYKKKIPEVMAIKTYDWLSGTGKTRDFIKTIYEINDEYHKNPNGWEMTEIEW